MSGIVAGRRIIFAKEVTAGTEVKPGTVLWRGTGLGDDQRVITFPPENIGYVAPLNRAYTAKLAAQLKINSTSATFEQLPYLFAMGIKNVTTGVADGAGSGKIYAYPLPTTAPNSNTAQTYSAQVGDDYRAEFLTYCFAKTIHLSGKAGEAVMMEADLVGRNMIPNTYTASTIAFVASGSHITDSANGLGNIKVGQKIVASGSSESGNNTTLTVATVVGAGDITVSESLTGDPAGDPITLTETFSAVAVPTVEDILFGNGKIYVDAVGGTIGATQQTATWLAFDIVIKTGWREIFTGDGNLYFTDLVHSQQDFGVEAKITFEHDAWSVAEKACAVALTPRKIRMHFDGTTLATAGTTYSKKALRMDIAGAYSGLPPLTEEAGNDTVTLTLRGGYNSTAALFASFTVVNSLSSLT
jgi:hypothetical protein